MSNAFRDQIDEDCIREAEAISRMNMIRRETQSVLALHCVHNPRLDRRAVRGMARGIRNGQRIWTRSVANRVKEE
jgi:hypothetical protein